VLYILHWLKLRVNLSLTRGIGGAGTRRGPRSRAPLAWAVWAPPPAPAGSRQGAAMLPVQKHPKLVHKKTKTQVCSRFSQGASVGPRKSTERGRPCRVLGPAASTGGGLRGSSEGREMLLSPRLPILSRVWSYGMIPVHSQAGAHLQTPGNPGMVGSSRQRCRLRYLERWGLLRHGAIHWEPIS